MEIRTLGSGFYFKPKDAQLEFTVSQELGFQNEESRVSFTLTKSPQLSQPGGHWWSVELLVIVKVFFVLFNMPELKNDAVRRLKVIGLKIVCLLSVL